MNDNEQNHKGFKIGDRIWFNIAYGGPSVGTITGFKREEINNAYTDTCVTYAKIRLNMGGTTMASVNEIYTSSDELLKANEKKTAERVARIKDHLPDVESLIRYMYDTAVSMNAEEYTDWIGRQAVQERAKELLGIDLDD